MDEDDESNVTPTTSNLPNGVAPRRGEGGGIDSLAMFRVVFRDALDEIPENIRKEVEGHFEAVTAESRRFIMSDSTQNASELAHLVYIRARIDYRHRSDAFTNYVYTKESIAAAVASLHERRRKRNVHKQSNDGSEGADAKSSERTASPKGDSSGRETSSEPVESMSKALTAETTFDDESTIGDVPPAATDETPLPRVQTPRRGIQVGTSSDPPIGSEPPLESSIREGIDVGGVSTREISSLVPQGGEDGDVGSFVEEDNEERMEALRNKWRHKTKKLANEASYARKDDCFPAFLARLGWCWHVK